MELVWWHWMVLGLGLGLLELFMPSFFIIWFGLGALLVGFAMLGVASARGEAQLQAARLQAEAQVTLADASAEAIRRVAAAIGSEDAPMRYMLGEKYIHAIGNLAKSDNAKTVLIPADIQDTLRGILGSRK